MQRKPINFIKMSGSGNDFIVVDNRSGIVKHASLFAKKNCRKNGTDGLLLVVKSTRRGGADFGMIYYNSDGSRASFCGNGARCIALFAYRNKITPAKMSFDSDAGLISAEVKHNSTVKIKMPRPVNHRQGFGLAVSGRNYEASFINTGVPHTVIFVKDVDKINVKKLGRAIRWHKKFQPAGTNVNFAKVIGKNKLQVRTYERGVEAETLACGTGITASAIIAVLEKYVKSPVSILTKGGEVLKVYFDGRTAYLEGKVKVLSEGKI